MMVIRRITICKTIGRNEGRVHPMSRILLHSLLDRLTLFEFVRNGNFSFAVGENNIERFGNAFRDVEIKQFIVWASQRHRLFQINMRRSNRCLVIGYIVAVNHQL